VNLPFIAQTRSGPVHLDITITRAKFDQLTRDLVERTTIPVNTALNDAGITSRELGRVLLVGGSTRIPAVQEHVRMLTGMQPSKGLNPDECVALGAAVQGGTLSGAKLAASGGSGMSGSSGSEILLLDVTPLSLSIETVGGVATRLINRNSTLPVHYSQIFTTAANFQTSVEIHVLQGERPMARDNKTIGKFRLSGIKRAMRGVPQIEVAFDLDTNGILKVSARDLGTGRSQEITISSSSNLSEEEIQRAMEDAKQYAAQDQFHKSVLETRNEGESLAAECKNALTVCGKQLDSQLIKQVKADLAALERILSKFHNPEKVKESELSDLQQAMERLKSSSAPLMQRYQEQKDAEG
jgi:molecular chaperone DnaK